MAAQSCSTKQASLTVYGYYEVRQGTDYINCCSISAIFKSLAHSPVLSSHCSRRFVKMPNDNDYTSQDEEVPDSNSIAGQKRGCPSALQLGSRKKLSVFYSTFISPLMSIFQCFSRPSCSSWVPLWENRACVLQCSDSLD